MRGHLAGNCRLAWSNDDRRDETLTRRADWRTARRLQNPPRLDRQNGLLKQLTKALLERALLAELTEHLGHGRTRWKSTRLATLATGAAKSHSKATLSDFGDFGELPIEIPRDRIGTFEPPLNTQAPDAGAALMTRYCRSMLRGMTVR